MDIAPVCHVRTPCALWSIPVRNFAKSRRSHAAHQLMKSPDPSITFLSFRRLSGQGLQFPLEDRTMLRTAQVQQWRWGWRKYIISHRQRLPHEHLLAFLDDIGPSFGATRGSRHTRGRHRCGTVVKCRSGTLRYCKLQPRWRTPTPLCGKAGRISPHQTRRRDLGDPVGTRGFCAGTSPGQDRVTQNSVDRIPSVPPRGRIFCSGHFLPTPLVISPADTTARCAVVCPHC